MAIHKPGQRHRYHNILRRRGGKRNVTATLSLTAMVDMFTVLVIFLLQNYNTTGQIIYIPKGVTLPKASAVKELRPAHVVTISATEIILDRDVLITFAEVKNLPDWSIVILKDKLAAALAQSKTDQESKLQKKLQDVVEATKGNEAEDPNAWSKVTVQADKSVDFLTIKKVLYTITEAGAGEINFAVTKTPKDAATAAPATN